MEKTIRIFLIAGAFYLIFDGLIHFFNLRLFSAQSVWPESALSYSTLLNLVYASFVFLTAGFAFVLQTDINKYKNFVIFSSFWAIFHALMLIFLSFAQNLTLNAKDLPSLYVWLPFYDEYLLVESVVLFCYAGLIFAWIGKKSKSLV